MKDPIAYGIIPARGQSSGVPNKNTRLFCGKPLIHYIIHAAIEISKKGYLKAPWGTPEKYFPLKQRISEPF